MIPFSSINIYHVNNNNLAIATSNSGVGTPSEEITESVTLTGTISTTLSNANVTGTGTLFTTQLAVGDFLFNATTNDYIGRVASITNNTALVLETGGAYVTTSNINFKKATNTQSPISGDILLRVGVVYVNPTTVNIPKISELRSPNSTSPSTYTDTNLISMTRRSNIGVPGSEVTASNIPLTIERLNVFTQVSLPNGNYFPNNTDLPSYIWYKLNAFGNLSTSLNFATRYNIFISQSLPEIAISVNMPFSVVNNGHY